MREGRVEAAMLGGGLLLMLRRGVEARVREWGVDGVVGVEAERVGGRVGGGGARKKVREGLEAPEEAVGVEEM